MLLAVSFALSVALTPAVGRVSARLGALDSPGSPGHVKRLRGVPNTGGVTIVLSIVLPLAGALVAANVVPEGVVRGWSSSAAAHLPGVRGQTALGAMLLACLVVLHVVGLIDDRRALGPWVKLGVMVTAAAGITLWSDTRLLTMLDGPAGGAWLSVVLTVAWIVAITNALNFIDNMDGLAGGVVVIAGSCFLAASVLQGQWFVGASLALLIGGTLGFLVYNLPPARIFMGDGGSLVLGFMLAFLTVRTTYAGSAEGRPDAVVSGAWYALFMPAMILAVPLYDLVTVSAVRVWRGTSPLVASPDHLSHRLVRRGLSKPDAVRVIWGLTAVTGLSGTVLGSLRPWQAGVVGGQFVLVLVLLAWYEWRSPLPPAGEA